MDLDHGRAQAPAAPEREAVRRTHGEPRSLDLLEDVRVLAPQLVAWRHRMWQLGSDELGTVLEALEDLTRAAQAAMAGVAAEAVGRGVVRDSRAASTTDWMRRQGGVTEPGRAHTLARVAEASLEPGTESLTEAVWGGGVAVDHAAVALKESEKVMPLLPGADRSEVLGHYLTVASSKDASRRTLRRLTREIMARYGEDRLDDLDERARRCSSLTERELPTGLVRFQLDLNQPDAARLRAAVHGLSAPRSVKGPDGTPVRDTRTPGHRRADALMELVRRAQAADRTQSANGCGLSGSTTLVVTMTADGLRQALAQAGSRRQGWGRGIGDLHDGGEATFGTTTHGDVLTATQLRRAACDAAVIPMVLGTNGAPLEVGRVRRLATGPQRAHMTKRDGGCTFPGCTRPPGWCEAHHVVHWADGGATGVSNMALLCGRHHDVVHRDGLSARLVDGTWEWDDPP
ncbi:HNH endonuclease signature motif containing protein [Kytococcus schroeteri]|uniref:HNH endonuclease signature motif containing protein n=1 Tax=Kytococcus schroeteri TaxID=138300 RepID=UPI001EE381C2|nr:HNH endonuclease signature motif containing protein [Kytococcus schroeteri]